MPIANAPAVPTAASLPAENTFARLLIIGVLLVNLVIAVLGIQFLNYARNRTIERVQNTTGNLAFLLEQNQIGRASCRERVS
jgi:hypothetical protein